jgi:DNA repair protein RadD
MKVKSKNLRHFGNKPDNIIKTIMKFTLREYQLKSVEAALSFFRDNNPDNGILVLPTGSGKSLIIANIVKELNENVLIFQPSKEILEQNYMKLLSYGFTAGIFSASLNRKQLSKITFATIGSLVNKTEFCKEFKYLIVDECHLVNSKGGMYEQFINGLGIKTLGLTATPYRLNSDGFGGSILKFLTRTRPRIFKRVIYFVQNKELFEQGYLAKLNYYTIPGFDRTKLKVNSTGADYDDRSTQHYYNEINFPNQIVDVLNRLVKYGRKNILVFTRFIHESEYITKNLPGSEIVTGTTHKKERERIIKSFKKGLIKTVCNVGVLTTGFDYPELETVLLARPTMSLALYYQMIGRGLRPHPGKQSTFIVDMCDNFRLFGKIEDIKINPGINSKWYISNGKKQLTNIYFER